jgi:quercetin dioxygenase-like cupin family protein
MTEHVLDDLHEYALSILEVDRYQTVKAHLRDCRPCSKALGLLSDALSDAVAPQQITPPSNLRSRLLADISQIAPYSIYHDEMAKILRGSKEALEKELKTMPHPRTWVDGPIPQCRLFPCVADAAPRDAIRTLVLMESGSHFPEHEHLGDETILILQGSLLHQDGKVSRPGEVLHKAKGTSHAFDVPEGLDLIYLAVVDRGIQIGDLLVSADVI